eukprot:Polyplicarium_translucidae@DN1730_c0_g1_i2.p1
MATHFSLFSAMWRMAHGDSHSAVQGTDVVCTRDVMSLKWLSTATACPDAAATTHSLFLNCAAGTNAVMAVGCSRGNSPILRLFVERFVVVAELHSRTVCRDGCRMRLTPSS